MVFLFNDVAFDLGDPRARFAASGCPVSEASLRRMAVSELLGVVKEAVFAAPDFPRAAPEKAQGLAAMVSMKTGANALLCLRAPDTADASSMHLRLGDVSLEVASDLMRRQKDGSLTGEIIDASVWAV